MKTLLILALLTTTALAEEPTKEKLVTALQKDPADSWALFNLGLMNYLAEDFAGAIKHWKTLRDLEPTDWRVREKLIQAYWGAGDAKAATAEVAELRNARNSRKYEALAEKEFFICDQFQIGKVRAFVLEYYELKGESPLAWKFILKSGDDILDYRFSVGSYTSATEFARAQGTIGSEERRYHLDGYWDDGSHATYGFYRNRPDYQDVRNEVQRIIKGETKPVSSMTPQGSQGEEGGAANPPKPGR